MKYFVCGVNCVGKTSILERLKILCPDIFCVKGSKSLMHFMRLGQDYEALRRCSQEERSRALNELVRGLMVTYGHDTMMFDAHVLNMVRGEIKDVTGDWLKLFDVFVLVDANPYIILERMKWSERDRALFLPGVNTWVAQLDCLTRYTNLYRERFRELANEHNKPVICLHNNRKTVGPAVGSLMTSMQRNTKGALG